MGGGEGGEQDLVEAQHAGRGLADLGTGRRVVSHDDVVAERRGRRFALDGELEGTVEWRCEPDDVLNVVERGVVAVETYSDEWLTRAPALSAQPGEATARVGSVGLRDRWWLFVIAIAALATEWALRRRQGLP